MSDDWDREVLSEDKEVLSSDRRSCDAFLGVTGRRTQEGNVEGCVAIMPDPRKVECAVCRGSGLSASLVSPYVTCSHCDGRGWIVISESQLTADEKSALAERHDGLLERIFRREER